MKKTKERAIEQICKKDNELRHQYESGKISKKEYDKKKKILHEEYSKLTNEKERIIDLVRSCKRRKKENALK